MPMMMEEYDDLFTDPLNLPPSPPPKGLHERLDDLRSNGSCQKVAWSKIGSIAYLSAGGREIRLAHLQHRKKTGTWDLNLHTDPMLGGYISKIYKGRELALVSWNPNGSELLVADVHGRLTICTTFIAVNRLIAQKAWLSENENHMGAVVGLMWLNTKRPIPFYRSAVKQNGQWDYIATQQEAKGPYNPWLPATKQPLSAFLVVTRGGYIKLAYQDQNTQWQDVKYEIDDLSTSDDLLTHATLCTDRGDSLLLAVHTAGKHLRLYRVTIEWLQSPGNDQGTSLPRLLFLHLETVDEFQPMLDQTGSHAEMFMIPSMEAQLSHLELIPPIFDMQGKEDHFPTLLATFSHLPTQYNGTELREQPFSILSRWELRAGKSTLHKSFSSLTSKKSVAATTLKGTIALKRLDDVYLDRIVIHVQLLSDNLVVAIGYSDGSTEFRDRAMMQILPLDEGPERATSLVQVGFAFRNAEPCLHMALSPNRCVKTFFGSEHAPKMSHLQADSADIQLWNYLSIEKVSAAFIIQHHTGAFTTNNNDDLLLTMQDLMAQFPPEQATQLERLFLNDLYRTLNIILDQTADPNSEKLLRTPLLQRALSLQSALGSKRRTNPRSTSSKVAWTILNLRMIALTVAFAFMQKTADNHSELQKPEILQSMVPIASYSLTLTDYLIDQLFLLNRSPSFPSTDSNSPALPLLLASTPRTLLKYNFRGLRGLLNLSLNNLSTIQPHPSHPSHHPSHNPALLSPSASLQAVFAKAHVQATKIGPLLAEVDSLVTKAYKEAGIGERERVEVERGMLVTGVVPEVLAGVVDRVVGVGGILETWRDGGVVNEGELFFGDFGRMGLEDEAEGTGGRADGTDAGEGEKAAEVVACIPVARPLGPDGKVTGTGAGTGRIRRCARCGAAMEDVLPLKGPSTWMSNLQRTCFCGGFWVV